MARVKNFLILLALSSVPTFFVWLPFILRLKSFWGIPLSQDGMATIVANFDGPLYLVVAKTLYNLSEISKNYSFPLPLEYYASHFPLFPLLIRLFSFVPTLGYPYSMLAVTIISSFLSIYFFNKLAKDFFDKKDALFLSLIFSILPARWLIVRSVGSPEPLFLAAIIASIFYFNRKNYLWAGVWGAIAQATKSPAILLFIAYLAAILFPRIKNLATISLGKFIKQLESFSWIPIFLIPISLLAVFTFYAFKFGNFWAYFNSGDNIHLLPTPFQIFNYAAPWVGTFWLEEVIFVYLIAAVGVFKLIRKKMYNFAWFVGIFFLSIIFVSHRDIVRYALPVAPFLIIAFSDTILKKEFKFIIAFLILPIYLFSLAFISQNVMPISDWGPFL